MVSKESVKRFLSQWQECLGHGRSIWVVMGQKLAGIIIPFCNRFEVFRGPNLSVCFLRHKMTVAKAIEPEQITQELLH